MVGADVELQRYLADPSKEQAALITQEINRVSQDDKRNDLECFFSNQINNDTLKHRHKKKMHSYWNDGDVGYVLVASLF